MKTGQAVKWGQAVILSLSIEERLGLSVCTWGIGSEIDSVYTVERNDRDFQSVH